jgi:hypothetical protein
MDFEGRERLECAEDAPQRSAAVQHQDRVHVVRHHDVVIERDPEPRFEVHQFGLDDRRHGPIEDFASIPRADRDEVATWEAVVVLGNAHRRSAAHDDVACNALAVLTQRIPECFMKALDAAGRQSGESCDPAVPRRLQILQRPDRAGASPAPTVAYGGGASSAADVRARGTVRSRTAASSAACARRGLSGSAAPPRHRACRPRGASSRLPCG